jgi:hypothetical protein
MVDVDVLKAQLVRPDINHSWGFRLHGGADLNTPVIIVGVLAGSPAANIGLQPGDEIVQVANTSTAALTHQQVLDLINNMHSNTLLMTVERRVVSNSPVAQHTSTLTLSQPVRNYQPMDMTGSTLNPTTHLSHTQVFPVVDYHTVQARPFEANRTPTTRLYESPRQQSSVAAQYQPETEVYPQYTDTADYNAAARPSVRYNLPTSDDNRYSTCPQSRTFKLLQTVMHNEEPAAGASGLPPPRSATMEQMRQQRQRQQPQAPGSQRVKVFMPQQYNSPMGMYSAHNVLETFTAQAESMLDTMDRRQVQHSGNEYAPIYSKN